MMIITKDKTARQIAEEFIPLPTDDDLQSGVRFGKEIFFTEFDEQAVDVRRQLRQELGALIESVRAENGSRSSGWGGA